jgi:outer membrane protein assembly factor BamB
MNALRFLICLSLCQTVIADTTNWPRFLGPNGSAKVEKADIPLKWSDGENVAWKTDLPGPGSSSPVVWGDRVFITCWSGYGDKDGATDMSKLTRHLVCLNRADGKILWDSTVPAKQPEDPFQGFISEHGYATHTPVTDGEHVYVFFGKSGALAFDLDGKQLWQTDLGNQSNRMRWGSAASPILYGDKVIVNASDESRAIYALDKKTGSQLWKAEGDVLHMAFGTPALVEREGVTDLLLGVPEELWAMNPDTGKLRWYALHGLPGNVSPCVVLGGGNAMVFGGYPSTGAASFKIGGKGDVTAANKLWSTSSSSYVPTPVLHDGHLYVVNDQGFALCLDAKTGDEIYRERALETGGGGGAGGRRGGGKPFYASPVLVGDRLYCVSRKSGTIVIKAAPKFEKLAVNTFASDTTQFNGSPAVVGDQMFLRSEKAIYCIATKK